MPVEKIGKTAIGYSYFFPYDDYDRVREEIKRGLDPIYKQFDVIYAIDGRYINYEHERDYSLSYVQEILSEYPNVVLKKVKPMFQTEKRQCYLDMAGDDNIDWLIVWDSDDLVHPSKEYQDWPRFWNNLKRYAKRYPDYQLFKMKSWIPTVKEWRRAYNHLRGNSWVPYIRIHRNPGQQRYCLFCHWYWCPKDATDQDLILQKRGMFVSDHTIDGVRFTTNSFLRGDAQLDTRDNWAWNNIHEENRRLYILQSRMMYADNKPDWMPTEFDGYWRYDKQGRPTTKICEEDGSAPRD